MRKTMQDMKEEFNKDMEETANVDIYAPKVVV
jgi:hypothetical protein